MKESRHDRPPPGRRARFHRTYPGYPFPLGVHLHDDGAQFGIFSRNATAVSLLFFEGLQDIAPYQVIDLDPLHNRTGDIWHIWVEGVVAGQLYAYRVDGPYNPLEGQRFNTRKLLLDPYATALSTTPPWDFLKAKGYDVQSPLEDLSTSVLDNSGSVPRCIVTGNRFGWEEDAPPKTSWSETIIYETHARGLTIHPSSGVREPGTFRGIIEKIPYFKELGITAVELLPIQDFNEREIDRVNPLTREALTNYWGYSTASFFAPKSTYAGDVPEGSQVAEFKRLVMELHKAGIEVILDIVFNHTAEGNRLGPTISFRGLDNTIYYMLEKDRRYYQNYSGCGNTVNCNHPVVRQFIIDCLTYWVIKMHVDGFRFDLASVMGRDEDGEIMKNPPLLSEISENPILRETKLIAEAWDAAGAYQVGSFPGHRWSEWNGSYRDDVRRFWRGDPGMTGILATRISGSADIYQKAGKEPLNSINFVTCHDGFTLNDLVSYNGKHNEANGEGNCDGTDENYSYNYGTEGESDDPDIEATRIRQIKNLIATLFVSRGVPLFLGGDEFRRTQRGNNNAYCQDNEISWCDWGLFRKNRGIFRFTREMIAFRKRNEVLREVKFYTEQDISWYGPDGQPKEWTGPDRSLAAMIHGKDPLYLMFHADFTEKTFALPPCSKGKTWYRAIDTSRGEPHDVCPAGREEPIGQQDSIVLASRSMAILIAR
ncbi:MAG: glycogen debranching protein GlgX [Syntrophorhabdales bacterium]|jgi:glycogen operon protein